MINFIIVAPPYTARSGGVMILHELCTALNNLGYNAGLAIITEGSQANQNFKFGFSAALEFLDEFGKYFDYFTNKSQQEIDNYIKNACVIYPDIIKGNPLNGAVYATYVLGKPLYEIISKYIISYSKIYHPYPNMVLYKPFLNKWVNDVGATHWSERKLNLTYIGKGEGYARCFLLDGTVLIERDWPKDKRQLAELLRNCKYFFSWDSITATVTDAVLCGAVPVLLQESQISFSEINSGELGSLPDIKFNFDTGKAEYNSIFEIDIYLENIKKNIFKYQENWLSQVEFLANELQQLNKNTA
jgi:hypothetical protein